MKKWFSTLFLLSLFSLFLFLTPKHSYAVDPFPPFSVEGNPKPEEYYDLFNLFRYVRPSFLKIYENMDRSRNYKPRRVCGEIGKPGKNGGLGDRRDLVCDNLKDGCTGGEVDLCFIEGGFAETVTSKNGSCSVGPEDPPGSVGECTYTKLPEINSKLKGTDFSAEFNLSSSSSSTPPPDSGETGKSASINFPKLQRGDGRTENVGNENSLTWGEMYLNNTECDINTRKLIVLYRASQTKGTHAETGEWPLGWVDWGFITPNGKTLLKIQDEIPGSIMGPTIKLVAYLDYYYMNGANLEPEMDSTKEKAAICEGLAKEAQKPTPAVWYQDLLQSPMYPPSFRQGYARASICVFNECCPGLLCPFTKPLGEPNNLYYDISVSREFGAALDEIQTSFSSSYTHDYLRKLMLSNPLIRFATSADKEAIPSKIRDRLETEFGNNNCLPYLPIYRKYTITWFGTMADHMQPDSFLGPNKTCPSYWLQPELSKETAGAFPESTLTSFLKMVWGKRIDDVSPVKLHLITVPDAMGQSISEMQQDVYNTQDTGDTLKDIEKYNQGLTNVVDNTSGMLDAGKYLEPGLAKRNLAWFTCGDPYFSAQTETGIEAYALGTRIGCSDNIEGVCDGQAFAKLLEKSNGVATTVSAKGDSYFKSTIEPRLTPELMKTYALAEKKTGVPCEILAGIHFVEADNNPEGSLVSGRRIGTSEPDAGGKVFRSLQETADYAGEHLLSKVGGTLKDVPTAITALSRYNGGGNSNCQLGYPYPIPYGGCPREFEGEDDPYPTNFLDDKHSTMYLLYCADRTACEPQVWERPGSYTVALAVYNNMTKNGNTPFKDAKPIPPPTPNPNATPLPVFAPKNCDPTSLDTALGCLPYDNRLSSTLLGFLGGISGAISLAIMLFGIIQIMTAAGDPKKLQHGKEQFTGAVVGLLIVIFSVTLLRLIAGDIIKLPGF